MQWDIKGALALREDIVLKVKEGQQNISQHCHGISRSKAYKWLSRYNIDASAGLLE